MFTVSSSVYSQNNNSWQHHWQNSGVKGLRVSDGKFWMMGFDVNQHFYSDNKGASWVCPINDSLNPNISIFNNIVHLGKYTSIDNGTTWSYHPEHLSNVIHLNSHLAYSWIKNNQYAKTTDKGLTWSTFHTDMKIRVIVGAQDGNMFGLEYSRTSQLYKFNYTSEEWVEDYLFDKPISSIQKLTTGELRGYVQDDSNSNSAYYSSLNNGLTWELKSLNLGSDYALMNCFEVGDSIYHSVIIKKEFTFEVRQLFLENTTSGSIEPVILDNGDSLAFLANDYMATWSYFGLDEDLPSQNVVFSGSTGLFGWGRNMARTIDNGKTWRVIAELGEYNLTYGTPIQFIDPIHGICFALSLNNLPERYNYTEDGGMNWKTIKYNGQFEHLTLVHPDSLVALFSVYDSGSFSVILRTNLTGTVGDTILGIEEKQALAPLRYANDIAHGNICYHNGTMKSLTVSENYGRSFYTTRSSPGAALDSVYGTNNDIAITNNAFIANCPNCQGGDIYTSLDSTDSWQSRVDPGFDGRNGKIQILPDNQDHVIAYGLNPYITTDGGLTWSESYDFPNISYPSAHSSNTTFYARSFSEIWSAFYNIMEYTQNGGQSWERTRFPNPIRSITATKAGRAFATDGPRLFVTSEALNVVGVNSFEDKNNIVLNSKGLDVYPNPCKDCQTLWFGQNIEDEFNYKVLDASGRLICSESDLRTSNRVHFKSPLRTGFFILIIESKSGSIYRGKFIVK